MKIQTNYQIGQDNIRPFGLDIHNPVFMVSGITIVLFVFYTLIFKDNAAEFFGWLRPAVTSTFDWFFLLSGNLFVLFALALIFTPLGKVRLGGQDARPDFGYPGWLAMLFAAGMGIGLMFFGVSEPISHFNSSLAGISVEEGARTDWAPLGAAAVVAPVGGARVTRDDIIKLRLRLKADIARVEAKVNALIILNVVILIAIAFFAVMFAG